MSYIGVPPVSGDFVVLDAITTSATASYTLQRSSVNFAPESANHMLVSLNGTIQKPNSSFTISGSTITFSSALTSSDVIDFILVLGNVNAVGVATTVADDAITDAKTNFVSTSSAAGLQIRGDGTTDGTLQLNCSQNSHGIKLKSPAHSASQSYTLTFPTTAPSANKIMQTDGSGNLSFVDAPSGGLVKISSGNGSAVGSLDLTSVFTSTYTNYYFVGSFTPVNNGADGRGRLMSGSSAVTNSEYRGIGREWYRSGSSGSSGYFNGYNESHIRYMGRGSSNSDNFSLNISQYIMHPRATSSTNTPQDPHIFGQSMGYSDSNEVVTASFGVNYQIDGDYDGFQFSFSSGNIRFYNYSLFGITGS